MRQLFLTGALLFLLAGVQAQAGFDFYVSNTGDDANNGTKTAPKRTIAGVDSAVSGAALPGDYLKVGFKSGDIFNETYNPGYPVHTGTYFPTGGKSFALLKGSKDYNTGWLRQGTSDLYSQRIQLSGFRGYGINNVGSYSYVYVFEIDRQLELSSPITARRMLKFVPTPELALVTPGSLYEPPASNVDSMVVYIHTSDGANPNNHLRYRYEVSTMDRAINSSFQQNNYFERLWATGFGAGNGMIPAGANSSFNRMIFGPGAGVHHLGLKGGLINNSLFFPGPKNTNGYAVVFYDVEGFRRHNTIRNSIFMDIKYPVYTHKSYGSNFSALELENVIAFGDTAEAVSFLESSDSDSIILKNTYCDNYNTGFAYARAKYVSIKNCIFKDVKTGVGCKPGDQSVSINNSLIRIGNIRNGERGYGINIGQGNSVLVANNIIHFKNISPVTSSDFAGYFLGGTGAANSLANVSGNIFICDIAPENYAVMATANTTNGSGSGSDKWRNNVYILLNGNRLEWRVNNRASNNGEYEVRSLQQWQFQSGQDDNSLFFDLRNDPRGLKAIFVDPDNGDYTLANTIEGITIRSIRAGMVNPVTCFLRRPTYEDAARIIMNDGVLTAGACRNPCNQGNIRTENRLTTNLAGNKTVLINWHIADESAVDRYEIVRSFGNNDFTTIASIPATTNIDYAYIDSNVMAGIMYRYSVALITKLNEKCYSAVSTVKMQEGKPINVYPNPSRGRVFVALNAYTGPVTITIHNVMGRKVYTKEVNAAYGIPVAIDLSAAAKGYYWINVQTDNSNVKQGFVLQ